jgi:hypothetical protein
MLTGNLTLRHLTLDKLQHDPAPSVDKTCEADTDTLIKAISG